MSIHPHGLKDWSAGGGTEGIDTDNKDKECNLRQPPIII